MPDVSVVFKLIYDLLVYYTFGNIYLFALFMMIFFGSLGFKMGFAADTIAAILGVLIFGFAAGTLSQNWLIGVGAIVIGIVIYLAVLKVYRE